MGDTDGSRSVETVAPEMPKKFPFERKVYYSTLLVMKCGLVYD